MYVMAQFLQILQDFPNYKEKTVVGIFVTTDKNNFRDQFGS